MTTRPQRRFVLHVEKLTTSAFTLRQNSSKIMRLFQSTVPCADSNYYFLLLQTTATLYKYRNAGHYPYSSLLLEHGVLETGYCLRLLVEPTQVGPIERATMCLETQSI
jgi:hypothetical protein